MNREFKLKVNAKWDLFLNVELEELLMYSGCRSLITYVMCAGISCQFVAFYKLTVRCYINSMLFLNWVSCWS